MKVLLKHFCTWLFGCFNMGLYLDDGIDSLVFLLRKLKIKEQAIEIEQIYRTIQVLEIGKCVLMLFSLLFLFLANRDTILDAIGWLFQRAKQAFNYCYQVFPKCWNWLKN